MTKDVLSKNQNLWPEGAIAVIGMAGRFPGAVNIQSFEKMLWTGKEGITHFDPKDVELSPHMASLSQHPDFVPAASILDGVDLFDAAAFGLSPREALLIDPQQRIFLECACEALDDAAINPEKFSGRIGVFGGCSMSSYLLHELMQHEWVRQADPMEIMVGCDKDFLATRVAYLLNLKGPAMTVQSACSTSMLAVHEAVQSILSGECDAALAGGATVITPQHTGYIYHPGGIRSPDGHCKPFDAHAQGTVFGSGAGLVVLRRLEDALADGDPIHALILATAANNDGRLKVGFTAPGRDGQAEVLSEALHLSGINATDVGYIETHGTGTPVGDPIEFSAICDVYGKSPYEKKCLLGSVKSNVGHLDAASGICGFIKTVLCLKKGSIPPTLHYQEPNPELELHQTRFNLSSQEQPWPISGTRYASISSFGVGGTNVHAVLQQAPSTFYSKPLQRSSAQDYIFPVSSASVSALTQTMHGVSNFAHDVNCADVAWTLQVGRKEQPIRKALVARHLQELTNQATLASTLQQSQRALNHLNLGFLFAGQGSQYPGMAKHLYEHYPVFRQSLDQIMMLFEEQGHKELRAILLKASFDDEGAQTYIKNTEFAQPAIFAVSVACASLWASIGISAHVLLGHSIGEWAAAVHAGVVHLEDAVKVVALRGCLMQAAPTGMMLSVELDVRSAKQVIEKAQLENEVEISVINSARLCVLSGTQKGLQLIKDTYGGSWLKTSHAFHSRSMDDAAKNFQQFLKSIRFSFPKIPMISNVTGKILSDDQVTNPDYWASQLRQPVQFYQGLCTGWQMVDTWLECGPGDGLCGLAAMSVPDEKIAGAIPVISIPSVKKRDDAQRCFVESVARLWEMGAVVDWSALYAEEKPSRIHISPTAFNRQRCWPDKDTKTPALVSALESAKETLSGDPLELMQKIWAQVLVLPYVGADDHFIELGGTSVIAMQIVARCKSQGILMKTSDILTRYTPRAVLEVAEIKMSQAAVQKTISTTMHDGPVYLTDIDKVNAILVTKQDLMSDAEIVTLLNCFIKVDAQHAMHTAMEILRAADRLNLRLIWNALGITAERLPSHERQAVTLEKAEDLPFLIDSSVGYSGSLGVIKHLEGTQLVVALHQAAGSATDALAVLQAWHGLCLKQNIDVSKLYLPKTQMQAPIVLNDAQLPNVMFVQHQKSFLSQYSLNWSLIEEFASAYKVDAGNIVCALVMAAQCNQRDISSLGFSVELLLINQVHRLLTSLPTDEKVTFSDMFQQALCALIVASSHEGAPFYFEEQYPERHLLWIGDFSDRSKEDAQMLAKQMAHVFTPCRQKTVLFRYKDELHVVMVAHDYTEEGCDEQVSFTLALEAFHQLELPHRHAFSPQDLTAKDMPLSDFMKIFFSKGCINEH